MYWLQGKNAKRHQMRRAKKGRAEAAAALEIIIKPLIHRSLLRHQPASNIAKLVEEEWISSEQTCTHFISTKEDNIRNKRQGYMQYWIRL